MLLAPGDKFRVPHLRSTFVVLRINPHDGRSIDTTDPRTGALRSFDPSEVIRCSTRP